MPKIAKKYTLKPIKWEETDDPVYPYIATINGDSWRVRINDFPDEQLYTLLINERDVGNFDSWPVLWKQPKKQVSFLDISATPSLVA